MYQSGLTESSLNVGQENMCMLAYLAKKSKLVHKGLAEICRQTGGAGFATGITVPSGPYVPGTKRHACQRAGQAKHRYCRSIQYIGSLREVLLGWISRVISIASLTAVLPLFYNELTKKLEKSCSTIALFYSELTMKLEKSCLYSTLS